MDGKVIGRVDKNKERQTYPVRKILLNYFIIQLVEKHIQLQHIVAEIDGQEYL